MSRLTPTLSIRCAVHPSDEISAQPHYSFPEVHFSPQEKFCLPLYLNCLGGSWEGHLVRWETHRAHVRLKGFPPLEISQTIQLLFFMQDRENLLYQFHGVIEDIQLDTPSSPWEGTTDILLKCLEGHEGVGSPPASIDAFPPEFVGGVSPPSQQNWSHLQELPLSSPRRSIVSTRLTIEKDSGQKISAYIDRVREGESTALPVVVISPGYGETKRDYVTLAYFFASNGFQVVRYDHTNHVGESDGVQYEASLSSMKEDFHTVSLFVKRQWPHSMLIGVASSLASRAVLKAEAERPSLSLLVMLMGIVNVQRSAAAVHQEDLFAGYCQGRYPESANFLGFNVGNQFLRDAINNQFVTLEETLDDVERLTSNTIVVSAGKDAWVAPDDLQAFRKALGRRVRNWIEVPEALHRLQENPKIAREVYRQVVVHCLEVTKSPFQGEVHTPNRVDLGRQNRKEKIALQKQVEMKVGPAFWQDYLTHFQSVGKCPDYIKLLDHLFHAMGPLTPGQRILDAGCGNGNAAGFLLHSLRSYHPHGLPCRDQSVQYVGIDVISDGLKRADTFMTSAISELQHAHSMPHPLMKVFWAQMDLNHPLPFPNNQFDRIISNLVLGYVSDPGAALNELYRVLAPGGRMIISNLKPDGDFSGIYQSLVHSAVLPQQREEARELLNNYGKIRQAEKEGQFCFYNRGQWESIVAGLDCKNAKIYPTFAGQAYLLILEKPAVCGQVPSPALPFSCRQSPNAASGLLKQVA